MTLKTFKNKKKEWCWHLKASNGEIVAQGEGYKNKKDMMAILDKIFKNAFKDTKKKEIIIPNPKWYEVILESIRHNLPYALVGLGAGYLGWKLMVWLLPQNALLNIVNKLF